MRLVGLFAILAVALAAALVVIQVIARIAELEAALR